MVNLLLVVIVGDNGVGTTYSLFTLYLKESPKSVFCKKSKLIMSSITREVIVSVVGVSGTSGLKKERSRTKRRNRKM